MCVYTSIMAELQTDGVVPAVGRPVQETSAQSHQQIYTLVYPVTPILTNVNMFLQRDFTFTSERLINITLQGRDFIQYNIP